MDIWNYHPLTGELLDKSVADPSPLEPGVFLIPAYATTMEPPTTQPGKAVVFKDDAWALVDDHRGETWWRAFGEPVVIAVPGVEVLEGLFQTEPPGPPPPPPRPDLTPEEKLAAAGLTVDELKALLGLN